MTSNELEEELKDALIGEEDFDGIENLPEEFYIVSAEAMENILKKLG